MAVPLVFGTLVIVGGAVEEGYSHMRQAISELGGVEADDPAVQNLNFLVTGLLVMAFAIGLHRTPSLRGGSVAGPLLVGLFGLGTAVAQPLLPCDPGCGGTTTIGFLHNATGLASFIAMVTGIFLLSRRFRRVPQWSDFATPSRVTAITGTLALILWIAVGKIAGVESVNGLLQRLAAGIVVGWIGVAALLAWKRTDDASSTGSDRPTNALRETTLPVRFCLYASAGVSAVGIVLLVIFFASGVGVLGTANDVAVIIQYVLMLPIAVGLHLTLGPSRPAASRAAVAVGLFGMAVVIVLQTLLVADVITFEQYIGIVSAGFLVVLGWFLLVRRLDRSAGTLPSSLTLHVLAGLYFGYPLWALSVARRMR
jgi:hypothetical protein